MSQGTSAGRLPFDWGPEEPASFDPSSLEELSDTRDVFLLEEPSTPHRVAAAERRLKAMLRHAHGLRGWSQGPLETLAAAAEEARDWRRAAEAYSEWVLKAEDTVSGHLPFGEVREKLGRFIGKAALCALRVVRRGAGASWALSFETIAAQFERAISYGNATEAVLWGAGYCYGQLGDFSRALAAATRYHNHFPHSPSAVAALIHNNLQVGDTAAARAAFDAVPHLQDHPSVLHAIAFLYLRSKEVETALECYERAAAGNRLLVDAVVQAGVCHAVRGRHDKAIRYYERALAAAPDNPLANFKFAQSLLKLGRPEEALRVLDRAIEARPNYAQALLFRGRMHGRAGRLELAIADMGKALELRPDRGATRARYAMLLGAVGRREEARDHYQAAAAYAEDDPLVRVSGAENSAHLGLLDEARAVVTSLRGRCGDVSRDVLRRMAATLVLVGDFEGTLEVLDHLLARFPNDPEAAYRRVVTLTKLGRRAEAYKAAELALSILPTRFDVRVEHAKAALLSKQYEVAAKAYADLVVEKPENASLHHSHGEALFGLERYCEAVEAFRKAVAANPMKVSTQRRLEVAERRCYMLTRSRRVL